MSNTTEVMSPMAAGILDAHNHAQEIVNDVKGLIGDAINASATCAALVDAARSEKGAGFREFWTDDVGLSPMEAKRYLSIHATAHRRDKRQLMLIGIIDPAEQEEPHERQKDPFGWCRLIPKIIDANDDAAIAKMDDTQRASVKKTLEPLVAIYNKL